MFGKVWKNTFTHCVVCDGSYNSGEMHVSVGWRVFQALFLQHGKPVSHRAIEGHGRCPGTSSVDSEMAAMVCAWCMVDRLLSGQNVVEELLPFTWTEDVAREPVGVMVPAENDENVWNDFGSDHP